MHARRSTSKAPSREFPPAVGKAPGRRRRKLGLGVALLVACACGPKERAPNIHSLDRGKAIPEERLPPTGERFFETRCEGRFEDYAVQCGFVLVDEGRASDRSIGVAVLRVFSNARNVRPDPVVYLEGGPGASPIASADYFVDAFAPLLAERDLIFVDQRGTGESLPRLSCGAEESIDGCYRELQRETDLSNYTTRTNARDVDLVRRELGYDEWNLYGISYGTRLGLTILRDFPEGVRSAVLDSVVPLEVDLLAELGPNGQAAFERVFDACLESPYCARAYPDSMTQLRAVAARMNEEPIELELGAFDGDTFVALLFQLLYSPAAIEFVPFLIDGAARDDFSLFEEFASEFGGGGGDGGFSFGMHLSVQCADEFAFSSRNAIEESDLAVHEELRGGLSGREYVGYCSSWPVEGSPALENEPVVASVPTLVFSGHFDPITPPRYGEQISASLTAARHFAVGDQSHGASVSACGLSMVNAFLDEPRREVSGDCLGETGDLVFESLRRPGFGRETFAFRTRAPNAEELERVREDLRLRRHLGAPFPSSPRVSLGPRAR